MCLEKNWSVLEANMKKHSTVVTHTSIAIDDMFKFEWVQSPEHSDAAHVVRLSHHLAGCQLLPDPQVPLQNLVSLVGKLAHEQNLVDGG